MVLNEFEERIYQYLKIYCVYLDVIIANTKVIAEIVHKCA